MKGQFIEMNEQNLLAATICLAQKNNNYTL